MPPRPLDVLALAERWAREMGKTTRMMEVIGSDGSKGAVLLISHQDHRVLVQARGTCIIVTVLIDIPPEVTGAIARQPPSVKKRIEVYLRAELASNGRTAFTLRPTTISDIEQIRRITVEQLVRISEGDPSSFNRLADAIQEVITTAARASSVLAPFLPSVGDPRRETGDAGFPSNMYA